MKRIAPLIAVLAVLPAFAQQSPPPRGPMQRPPIDFARELNISQDKADKVQSILSDEMDQHRAVHEKAMAEMSKVLTPDQVQRFEDLMRPPRMRGNQPPPR